MKKIFFSKVLAQGSALSDIRVPYDDKISRIIQKHM